MTANLSTKYLVFTDLDGALLDHDTYDYEAARATTEALKGAGIALICNSSKTDAEIRGYVEDLDLKDPFISEGGGLLFFLPETFPSAPEGSWEEGGRRVVMLGCPVEELAGRFKEMRAELGLSLRAFFEMSDEELVGATGLPREKVPLMRARRASVPFLSSPAAGEEEVAAIRRWAEGRGLGYTRGGRFHHLTGATDKGKAAAFVTRMYREVYRRVVTVGVGDGLNDLPLLRWVDHPIAIPAKGGVRPELSSVEGVRLAPAPGPAGWRAAVEGLFHELIRGMIFGK